jgi:hypothetical protein
LAGVLLDFWVGITGFVVSALFTSKTLAKARCDPPTPINLID